MEKHPENPPPNRALSNDDVEAIAEAIQEKMWEEFYTNLGRGIWALAWRGFVMVLIAIAAYGAVKGVHN